MKKIYRVEQENNFNGGIFDFTNCDEAVRTLTKILHDEANYHYNINKDNTYSICEVNVINEDEYEYEEEYFDTLISISVKDYRDMSADEKEKIGLKY